MENTFTFTKFFSLSFWLLYSLISSFWVRGNLARNFFFLSRPWLDNCSGQTKMRVSCSAEIPARTQKRRSKALLLHFASPLNLVFDQSRVSYSERVITLWKYLDINVWPLFLKDITHLFHHFKPFFHVLLFRFLFHFWIAWNIQLSKFHRGEL